VLDPFCGTGTTLVECRKLGIASVGLEANPMACFASQVKLDWGVDPDQLAEHAGRAAAQTARKLHSQGVDDEQALPLFRASGRKRPAALLTLPPDAEKLLLGGSISPIPLHKTLTLLGRLRRDGKLPYHRHELLALAKALVTGVGNLHFGPEVGVGPAKLDVPVIREWLACVLSMVEDLRRLPRDGNAEAQVHYVDSRDCASVLPPRSIDAVITSPPYPNEKDYTRTTRLESVILGFIANRQELRVFKKSLLRSNTRNVYRGDDDDKCIAAHGEIDRIAREIESRRQAMGKTSGFERMYSKVTRLYFGGLARHLGSLRAGLKPGAPLAYVVGDQASYLRVMIPTGRLLAEIAQSLGYQHVGTELFRTRLATATREQLREEVVLLRWPG